MTVVDEEGKEEEEEEDAEQRAANLHSRLDNLQT